MSSLLIIETLKVEKHLKHSTEVIMLGSGWNFLGKDGVVQGSAMTMVMWEYVFQRQFLGVHLPPLHTHKVTISNEHLNVWYWRRLTTFGPYTEQYGPTAAAT